MRHLLKAGICGAALVAVAGPALAGGFYIQEQSVKGLGRAYSGEASDTGAESMWWNPAAIAGVQGIEVANGLNAVTVDGRDNNVSSTITRPVQGPAPIGGDPRAYNPVKFGVVPNFGAAWRLNDRLSVGLSVNAPFNVTTKNSTTSWARYQGEKSLLFNIDIQPTVSFRVNQYLDLGVGFDAQYVDSTLTNALPNLSPLLPDGQQKLSGDGWDYGYVGGLQFHPNARLTFGASYRSMIKHTLEGSLQVSGLLGPLAGANANITNGASANFKTPWIATLGGRFQATDKLAVSAQVQHFGWSVFDAIRVSYPGGGAVVQQNYRDTTSVALGGDYDVNAKWTLRAGAQYDPTPTPNIGRTVRIPDANRFLVSIGTTVRPTAHMSLDFAAAWIDFQGSRVTSDATAYAGTAAVTPINIMGDVAATGAVLSAGARMTF